MEIHVLHQQGCSIHRIAKDLGISRNTVRTYLRDKTKVSAYPERQFRPTKLQPYHDYLRTRIETAKSYWIPATVLLRELTSLGYESGITMLKEHIKQYKPSTPVDPVVRFETLPGEQMQVDFTTITQYATSVLYARWVVVLIILN